MQLRRWVIVLLALLKVEYIVLCTLQVPNCMVVCSCDLREALRTAFILFPVLGLCWLLGLFIFGENLTYIAVIEWIFFVVVTAQGVLIFLLHCVINKEVLFTSLVFQHCVEQGDSWMDKMCLCTTNHNAMCYLLHIL